MVCIKIPGAAVALGADAEDSAADERPVHRARLDCFMIDQEPVSTTAYCRFLNSIGNVGAPILHEWFVLTPDDRRQDHVLLRHEISGWSPHPGVERMPMMLVSWYGANAYSLWANRRDWQTYREEENGGASFLPTEAQWEYAARGPESRKYPWGDDEATQERMRYGCHERGRSYRPETLPIAEVNEELALSPFGLRHMAGNVWHWCRDWYSPDFYTTPEASTANPVNRQPTRVRSERGGSWIGPAFLCRSSYRRGRVPAARGRCLGFRCTSDLRDVVSGNANRR